jgi:hypothetical protein
MERLTLSFPSVFDLHAFRKEVDKMHSEARVNLLTGSFTLQELEIATTVYKAQLIRESKE